MSREDRERVALILDGLTQDAVRAYGESPVPSGTDETVARLVRSLAGLPPGEREQILSDWFEPHQLQSLTLFAMRMCEFGARERDPDLVAAGLLAQALEGFRSLTDDRVVAAVLDTIGETARGLSLDLSELVSSAAAIANPEAGRRLLVHFA